MSNETSTTSPESPEGTTGDDDAYTTPASDTQGAEGRLKRPKKSRVLKWVMGTLAVLIAIVVFAALAAQSQYDAQEAGDTAGSDAAQDVAQSQQRDTGFTGGNDSAESAPESSAEHNGGASTIDVAQRYVISTATAVIGVELDEMESSVRAAEDIVIDGYDGVVESREERYSPYEGDVVTTRMTFRVPSEDHSQALAELTDLGEVESITEHSDDVTDTVVELDTRIENAESSLERLREFMDESESVEDLLSIEEQVESRQADLEVMLAQREDLADRAELSTLHIVFEAEVDRASAMEESPFEPRDFEPGVFTDGLERGFSAVVVLANTLLIGLGLLLPWSPLLLVAAVIAWLLVRKKRSSRAAARSQQTQDE